MVETRRLQVVYSVEGKRKADYFSIQDQPPFNRHRTNKLLEEAVKMKFGENAKFHHIKYSDRSY